MKSARSTSASYTLSAAASTAALFLASPASSSENCLYQLSGPAAPYYVLGSSVTPQSNYLVVDRCDKSAEDVRADLVAPARERAKAVLDARQHDEVRAKQVQEQGDALMRRRDEAMRASAEERPHWWSWIWQ